MYQHDWGCIVTLDDFFGTAPNTNDKIEHHPGAICPHCKQSIILTDDGRFVSHNEPGWTSKPIKDEIYMPTKCIGSGTKPEETHEGEIPGDNDYILKLIMKILSIPQRLWKPMRHNIRTKLLHIRNRLIKNGNVDGSVIETKEITLTCGWCGVKLVPGVYHTCLEKPWKIDFDNAVDVLFAKVLAEKFTSEEAMLGLKKKDVADVLDTIIKENRKRGVSDRFLELHGNDVVDYVYDKVRLARKQDKIRTTRSE
jgi:hypothetical protein